MEINDVKIGTYVRDSYGNEGRVSKLHDSCPEGAWWLAGQANPALREHADGPWASVLCEPAGSVCSPVSLLEELEPFEFTNSYGDKYFAEIDAKAEVSEHETSSPFLAQATTETGEVAVRIEKLGTGFEDFLTPNEALDFARVLLNAVAAAELV